jgi:LuxR family maltose regulon positive regulatory protein
MCLKQDDKIPNWIFEYEYPKHMHFLSIGYANIVYGKALLLKKENLKVLGLADAFHRQSGIFPNLLGNLYTYIYSSIAAFKLNRIDESKTALKNAFDIAMPDNLIMPFVENGIDVISAFELLKSEKAYANFIQKIQNTYEVYRQSVENIISENFIETARNLTFRERQIALLAIDGMHNSQIAEVLKLSPNTVKAEMKSVFRKLGINSRALLKSEMLQ